MVRGRGGSTRTLFVNAVVASTSASRSAFQLVILILPNIQPIGLGSPPPWQRGGMVMHCGKLVSSARRWAPGLDDGASALLEPRPPPSASLATLIKETPMTEQLTVRHE